MRLGLWVTALVMILAGSSPSVLGAPPPYWPTALTIATASPGGVYLIYGRALAPILSEALGIQVTAQATQGSAQNVLLLEKSEVQLGFVTMGVALQAWNGTGGWTHREKLRVMRALFPMYDTPFQFVASRDSGIKSLADLAGKRIGVGPQGGTGGSYGPLALKALGIEAALRYGAWDTMETQLRSHLLDAFIVTIGAPTPLVAKLDDELPLLFIAPGEADIAALRRAMPELGISVVPARTYTSLTGDYKTLGLFNFAVASKALPDDLVYSIVKAFYANHDRMVKVLPAAKESVVANLRRNEFLPYHPGAVRYYREVGAHVPGALASDQ
jgi:TRAP transporter TAXI family solute receptor